MDFEKEMRQLVDILNKYAYEYYVLDAPSVSDREYDALYDRLRFLEQTSGRVLFDSPTKRVGGEPIDAFKKHEHINRLYSLDKAVTYEQLEAFDERVRKVCDPEYTVEYKFDGLTICLTYDKGKFVRATTRGNGSVGEDVTAQVLTIKTFPLVIKYQGTAEIQGEAIIRLSALEEYNKTADEPLKNARNAVAGAIRNLDPKVTERRKPEILFYNVNYMSEGSLSSQTEIFKFLKENGFKTFDFLRICKTLDEVKTAIEEIDLNRKTIDVLTDGAVVKLNSVSAREELGATDKFPRWAIAYKFEAEEAETTLEKVVWQVGRTGKLTPLGILKAVELGGATVRKATLNNYGDICRKKVTAGCVVRIRRSNEVIPEILGKVPSSPEGKEIVKPTVCPYCKTAIVEIGANIFCPNKNCKPRIIAKLTNFAQKDGANIEGFSEMTASLLYDKFNTSDFSDLYALKAEDLLKLDGFKGKKTENLLSAIEKSKTVPLSNFIFSLGIEGVGKKTAKDLAKKYKTVDNLFKATSEDLRETDEIGEVIASSITEYFSDEQNMEDISKMFSLGVKPQKEKESTGGVFSGEKVVLTGSLQNYTRSEAAKLIEERGGEVGSSVTKTTTLVLAGDSAGSKLDKAKALGIKIIGEDEFNVLLST